MSPKGPVIKWFVIEQKRGQTGGKQKITLLANDASSSVNNSRVTVNVIVFAMLPAHGIWRETVSLLNVKCEHELANEWVRCSGKNASYITTTAGALQKRCVHIFGSKETIILERKIRLVTLSYNYTVQASKKRETEK